MASWVTLSGQPFEAPAGQALLAGEVTPHFSDRAELCCIDFTNFFVFVHKRYRGGQGVPAVQRSETPAPGAELEPRLSQGRVLPFSERQVTYTAITETGATRSQDQRSTTQTKRGEQYAGATGARCIDRMAPGQIINDLGRKPYHVRHKVHEQRVKIEDGRISRRISLRFDIRAQLPRRYRTGFF
ncbi:MAG: hypothetical protein A4E35_01292 [Methanoregula sp. PtaU1.Bin051]|nr:MAG: hypothetical protein A4E35_01292 [Methanoregula sp. PtaU1.Bin051]